MSKLSANWVLDEFYSTNDNNPTYYETENDYKTSDDKYEKISVNESVNNRKIEYDVQAKNKTLHDLGLTIFAFIEYFN